MKTTRRIAHWLTKPIAANTTFFVTMYVLGVLCVGSAVRDLIMQINGTLSEYMSSFTFFSYLIALLAVLYVKMYISTRIEIDATTFHFVCPFYVKPADGAKRAMFIYRQGANDVKLVNKKFALADIIKYGYIEDLGYNALDQSGAGQNNKLFPVHEMALVMKDGKRYHVNAGYYSKKQLTAIVGQIVEATKIYPTGALAADAGTKEAPKAEA